MIPVPQCPICGEFSQHSRWRDLASHVDNKHWGNTPISVGPPPVHAGKTMKTIAELMIEAHKEDRLKEFILQGMMELAFK